MFSDGVELWRRIRQLDADSADRHRRARTAAGIGIITFASAAVALVVSIPAHGITLVTAMLVTVLVGQLLVIHLGRTNRPTAAGLVFTATVVLVPVVAVALTHRIDTWPLAVPATALVLTFLLPLRWTPLILTGGMAVLAVLSWQAATFDSPPVPLDQMLRDSAIILGRHRRDRRLRRDKHGVSAAGTGSGARRRPGRHQAGHHRRAHRAAQSSGRAARVAVGGRAGPGPGSVAGRGHD